MRRVATFRSICVWRTSHMFSPASFSTDATNGKSWCPCSSHHVCPACGGTSVVGVVCTTRLVVEAGNAACVADLRLGPGTGTTPNTIGAQVTLCAALGNDRARRWLYHIAKSATTHASRCTSASSPVLAL